MRCLLIVRGLGWRPSAQSSDNACKGETFGSCGNFCSEIRLCIQGDSRVALAVANLVASGDSTLERPWSETTLVLRVPSSASSVGGARRSPGPVASATEATWRRGGSLGVARPASSSHSVPPAALVGRSTSACGSSLQPVRSGLMSPGRRPSEPGSTSNVRSRSCSLQHA